VKGKRKETAAETASVASKHRLRNNSGRTQANASSQTRTSTTDLADKVARRVTSVVWEPASSSSTSPNRQCLPCQIPLLKRPCPYHEYDHLLSLTNNFLDGRKPPSTDLDLSPPTRTPQTPWSHANPLYTAGDSSAVLTRTTSLILNRHQDKRLLICEARNPNLFDTHHRGRRHVVATTGACKKGTDSVRRHIRLPSIACSIDNTQDLSF